MAAGSHVDQSNPAWLGSPVRGPNDGERVSGCCGDLMGIAAAFVDEAGMKISLRSKIGNTSSSACFCCCWCLSTSPARSSTAARLLNMATDGTDGL